MQRADSNVLDLLPSLSEDKKKIEALRVAEALLDAVKYLKEKNKSHEDIKIDNVFIIEDFCYLADGSEVSPFTDAGLARDLRKIAHSVMTIFCINPMLYLFRDERPEYSPGFGVEATALFNRLAESKLGLDDAISMVEKLISERDTARRPRPKLLSFLNLWRAAGAMQTEILNGEQLRLYPDINLPSVVLDMGDEPASADPTEDERSYNGGHLKTPPGPPKANRGRQIALRARRPLNRQPANDEVVSAQHHDSAGAKSHRRGSPPKLVYHENQDLEEDEEDEDENDSDGEQRRGRQRVQQAAARSKATRNRRSSRRRAKSGPPSSDHADSHFIVEYVADSTDDEYEEEAEQISYRRSHSKRRSQLSEDDLPSPNFESDHENDKLSVSESDHPSELNDELAELEDNMSELQDDELDAAVAIAATLVAVVAAFRKDREHNVHSEFYLASATGILTGLKPLKSKKLNGTNLNGNDVVVQQLLEVCDDRWSQLQAHRGLLCQSLQGRFDYGYAASALPDTPSELALLLFEDLTSIIFKQKATRIATHTDPNINADPDTIVIRAERHDILEAKLAMLKNPNGGRAAKTLCFRLTKQAQRMLSRLLTDASVV